MIATQWRT